MSKNAPRHAGRTEWWITAASLIKRGWVATPRHARGGRHADSATRSGRAVLARVHGERFAAIVKRAAVAL